MWGDLAWDKRVPLQQAGLALFAQYGKISK